MLNRVQIGHVGMLNRVQIGLKLFYSGFCLDVNILINLLKRFSKTQLSSVFIHFYGES